MRSFARFTVRLAAVAAVMLAAVSCGESIVRRRLQLEGVESVSRLGWSGLEIGLRVSNRFRRDVKVDSCRLIFVTADGNRLAVMEMRGGVTLPRRATSGVRVRMKVTSVSPAAIQLLWRRLSRGEAGDIEVAGEIVAGMGKRRREISFGRVPVSEILNIFGMSEQDFGAYFSAE